MTAHLTNEELTNQLMNQRSSTVEVHLHNCDACRAELGRLRESLDMFRLAAYSWSENAAAFTPRPQRAAISRPVRTAEWAIAAALLLMLVVLPALYWREHTKSLETATVHSVVTNSQAQISQDNALLSAVNSEIAEGVPAPMQPLRVSLTYGAAADAAQAK